MSNIQAQRDNGVKSASALLVLALGDYQKAHDLLLSSGTSSPSQANNFAHRIPNEQKLIVGSKNVAGIVGYDGTAYEGDLPPNLREIADVYAAVLELHPEVDTVLHTHSPYLTGWAIAQRPLPVRYSALLRFSKVSEIPVATWGPRYAKAPVIEAIKAHSEAPAVLLGNRGLLAWGVGIQATAQFVVILEEGAHFTLIAEQLGGAKDFPPGAFEAVQAGTKIDLNGR
jgi:L-ribulose-5-phosphate 4-epimerase